MASQFIISCIVLIPLLSFGLALGVNKKDEKGLTKLTLFCLCLELVLLVGFTVYWVFYLDAIPTNIREFVLYKIPGYEFLIDFYFDRIAVVFLFVGTLITLLVVRYSSHYLHMEDGFKRFFTTILFFYTAYTITVLAGNFETLFIGWEMLGISSFLLIAFYRTRYLPVRNAVKVFSIYRIGDIGLLLAMWGSHHLWNENITFLKLSNDSYVLDILSNHGGAGLFIALGLWVAAAAKSAQMPFSAWLPRAMEGPTPSSAIFYGSLSVHLGVFLLLRTFPFWEHQTAARIMIGGLGALTTVIAFPLARVQASIKSQIAYASMAQIGLMFIELAMGLETLVLTHFTGNAFLRTYQLLVSPSIVSYLIRDQFYHFKPQKVQRENSLPQKLENTIYILALKEWNLDKLLSKWVFQPIKRIGKKLDFLSPKNLLYFFLPIYGIGFALYLRQDLLPASIRSTVPILFGVMGVLMIFKAFSERQHPILAWLLVMAYHFWIALAVSFNESFDYSQTLIYLSGPTIFGIMGYLILVSLQRKEPHHFSLNQYHGHVQMYRYRAFAFLLASLGMMGFPISPTFIGVDLLFNHTHENQYFLAFLQSTGFIVGGISLIRIYARLFLGPYCKNTYGSPLKSA